MITASPTLTRVRTRPQISLAAAAAWLLRDLESRRLSVALRAAPDKRHSGHKVRCVESRNPAWYRQLCAQHITHRTRPRRRKPKFVDTLIKRRHVLRALAEIQRGGGGIFGIRPPRPTLCPTLPGLASGS